jgi:hypothetical protein
MCGQPYDKCTKESFMYYLGVSNPQVPFPIYIGFPNETSEEYSYYNQTTFMCDEPLISRYENKTACGCLVSKTEDSSNTNYIYIFRIVRNHVVHYHRMFRIKNLKLEY